MHWKKSQGLRIIRIKVRKIKNISAEFSNFFRDNFFKICKGIIQINKLNGNFSNKKAVHNLFFNLLDPYVIMSSG